MKKISIVLFMVMTISLFGGTRTVQEFIEEASQLEKKGQLKEATEIMERANAIYPDQAEIYAKWGILVGKQAGNTQDFLKAGEFSFQSFQLLDKAIILEPANINARLYRGIMGANVPDFMGKLDQSVQDFNFILEKCQPISNELNMTVLYYLGITHEKKGEYEKSLEYFKAVALYGIDSGYSQEARKHIEKLEKKDAEKKSENEKIDDEEISFERGNQFLAEKKYNEAANVFRKITEKEPENVHAYLMLAQVLGIIAETGYDKNIHESAEYMSNLAFEVMDIFDKIVSLDPDNIEIRLLRNEIAIELPFFVGKLNDSIEDLKRLIENKPEHQARAYFLLGKAYKKLGNSYWAKAATVFSDADVKEQILKEMKPSVKYFNEQECKKPCLVMDFILGFQDELAPQIAIWIEDEKGKFIKTIYISAFSAYVKEKQVQLPKWAKSSNFEDAEIVTGASIDVGHHIYTWDLTDIQNKKVSKGEYVVHFEICHWPHVIYEHLEIPVEIEKKTFSITKKDSEMIPEVHISYFSK